MTTGATGHAEAVEITFDPKEVSYGKLLQVYFSVAHNPTQLNYQGPDRGTQYRSAIFFTSEAQQKVAKAYVDQLTAAKSFEEPIVTEITPMSVFYPAEDYHQDYYFIHPESSYIQYHDVPKVENLEKFFRTSGARIRHGWCRRRQARSELCPHVRRRPAQAAFRARRFTSIGSARMRSCARS